jgi:DNA-binding MarR family transcriptional regulator
MTVATGLRARHAAPTASKQRLRLWLRLLRASRAIESELRERLRLAFDITLPQFDVMAALDRNADGMTMTELSRFLMVSNGNVTGIIDRLVVDGMVVRATIDGDRRGVRVRLTAKGAARFSGMAEQHECWVDEILSEFTKADADVLIAHFDEMMNGLAARARKGG